MVYCLILTSILWYPLLKIVVLWSKLQLNPFYSLTKEYINCFTVNRYSLEANITKCPSISCYCCANYPHMNPEDICFLCATTGGQETDRYPDTQQHLLECKLLKNNAELIYNYVKYDDIFASHIRKQVNVALLLESKFKMRKKLEGNLSKT